MLSSNNFNLLAFLFVGVLSLSAEAFVTPSSPVTRSTGCRSKNGFILGPVARNGMEFDDEKLGEGRRVLPGDTVYCYYVGSFETAGTTENKGLFGGILGGGDSTKETSTVFDQVTEGEPFKFDVGKGQVIQGIDLGILGFDGEIPPMNVGGKRKLKIPSRLAYGDEPMGTIPANQDLQFDLEILDAGYESTVSTQTRLVGYGVALAVPVVILAIAFNLLSGN